VLTPASRLRFDDIKSAFVDVTLAVRTDGLDADQLSLLPLLLSLLLESPVHRGDALIPHATVVAELAATTLSCGASCGFGGGRFSVGGFGTGLALLSARCELGQYTAAASLLADCLLRGQAEASRVRAQAQKALNAVPRAARDGGGCAAALLRERIARPDSAQRRFQFSVQQRALSAMLRRLEESPEGAIASLEALRDALLAHPSRVLLHVSGDLSAMGPQAAAVWADCLAPGLRQRAAGAMAALPLVPGRVALASSSLAPEARAGGWARCLANSAVVRATLYCTRACKSVTRIWYRRRAASCSALRRDRQRWRAAHPGRRRRWPLSPWRASCSASSKAPSGRGCAARAWPTPTAAPSTPKTVWSPFRSSRPATWPPPSPPQPTL